MLILALDQSTSAPRALLFDERGRVLDREAIARQGIKIQMVQDAIEVATGGRAVMQTVEGRERHAVRVRHLRELRGSIEGVGNILVAAPGGAQVPLEQIARIDCMRGTQMLRSEDTQLTGYVITCPLQLDSSRRCRIPRRRRRWTLRAGRRGTVRRR